MKKITILLCLFWMGFIFYMSSNNGETSHEQSITVVNFIENAKAGLQSKIENKVISESSSEAGTTNENLENKTTNKNLTENKVTGESSKANNNINKVNSSQVNNLDHIIRKNAHGFMYMILAVLVSSMFIAYNKGGKNSIVYILFICLFYAVTDEFHQSFIPGRTSLASDILIDFGGAIIGLTLLYLFYYKIYRRYVAK